MLSWARVLSIQSWFGVALGVAWLECCMRSARLILSCSMLCVEETCVDVGCREFSCWSCLLAVLVAMGFGRCWVCAIR